ncbi:MAG TPA: bifunctional 4-hydroxy-2-oxoglutarate aldolase/2-dehydro-3-deoxy-phosphogluconate aldolase [Chitinophagaceae bacterium]|nr:bifunctional 4-hydroxy-2-oxoglutarate aldolase/2-dehydro-3-deoxy-phosphogluconate aldolase [Chitinophagaceae bacterium]
MNQPFSWDLFGRMPVLGIMRSIAPAPSIELATLFHEAGFGTLEITMNSPEATKIISMLSQSMNGKLNIGAGTVCNMKDLDEAIGAGAQFIVTPILNQEVIERCVAMGIPIFPGAYTPSEIYAAWSLGASMVKVFPATQLGPGYIKEVLAPLHQVALMPTGGINLENFTSFLAAGAKAVAIGSSLFPPALIAAAEWLSIKKLFASYAQKYRQWSAN